MFEFIKKLLGLSKSAQIAEEVAVIEKTVKEHVKKIADVNNDGKVNTDEVKAVVKKIADVNNDGKVNIDDVKAVVKKRVSKKVTELTHGVVDIEDIEAVVKKYVSKQDAKNKVVENTPKPRGRKPKAQ